MFPHHSYARFRAFLADVQIFFSDVQIFFEFCFECFPIILMQHSVHSFQTSNFQMRKYNYERISSLCRYFPRIYNSCKGNYQEQFHHPFMQSISRLQRPVKAGRGCTNPGPLPSSTHTTANGQRSRVKDSTRLMMKLKPDHVVYFSFLQHD